MKGNFVAKHLYKSSRAKIEPSKRQKLLDVAQQRESLETILEAKIDGKCLNIEEEE